jgi:hypothetical protein
MSLPSSLRAYQASLTVRFTTVSGSDLQAFYPNVLSIYCHAHPGFA